MGAHAEGDEEQGLVEGGAKKKRGFFGRGKKEKEAPQLNYQDTSGTDKNSYQADPEYAMKSIGQVEYLIKFMAILNNPVR